MRALLVSVATAFLLATTSVSAGLTQLGQVRTGDLPIPFAHVTLYRAGHQKGSGAVAIGSGVSDIHGRFSIEYRPNNDPQAVLYLIADGPFPETRLATVLGPVPFPDDVTINERTTVATAYAMAQFIDGHRIGGASPGLQNAAGTLRNLVDLRTGDVGHVLGTAPNGDLTTTMRTFNSLANALSGAVRHLTAPLLFHVATPPGGPAPKNTLEAAVNIAHNSWNNPLGLYFVSALVRPYQPARSLPPITWTLALKYVGNGHELDGPGAMSFDENGDVWIVNNYNFRFDHSEPTCGGRQVLKLTATGEDFPGAPYDGNPAGVNGAGFGVCIDPHGDVWVGNFGFFGGGCPCELAPPANSVSKLSRDGHPLSPPTGFTQGCISGAQGTVSDKQGNIWIANACGGTITKYLRGNPDDNWVYSIDANQILPPGECQEEYEARPFDIAIDKHGGAWVTDNDHDTVFHLSADGVRTSVTGSEAGIAAPLGIAVDSKGNVWVSNSGVVNVPCVTCIVEGEQDYGNLVPDLLHSSVTKLDSKGNFVANYAQRAGLWIPWGIAVDGDDNIWVANFGGFRLSALQGDTGKAIAPFGFYSDALERITGVSIDTAGNVWLCNNWITEAVDQPTNRGGDSMVVFIGLAAPVKTPLIGPPQKPGPPNCRGDINHDDRTDSADFAILATSFGMETGATLDDGDLTGDGAVNMADFAVFASEYQCHPGNGH